MPARVYFDHASTTSLHPEVLEVVCQLQKNYYANSESLYDEGARVHQMMEQSRKQIADLFSVESDEIIFTSGGSEANSMAIKGYALSEPTRKHIITSAIEHSSVLNACKQLEEVFGYRVTRLGVNEQGVVSVEELKKHLTEDTCLVSIMMVNNEVGSIQPIDEIKKWVKYHSHAMLHVDMTQAIGKMEVSFQDIDMVSFSAHKLHGLKGSGVLMKRKHVPMIPLINGGQQEHGVRGGTANAISNIVLFKTVRLAMENQKKFVAHTRELMEACRQQLSQIEGIQFNSPQEGCPAILNISTPVPSQVMLNALNAKGYLVSAQSTCESKSTASHVLAAMGFSEERNTHCIRISFGLENTLEEVKGLVESIKEGIEKYG